jgi:hypothetical protein
MLPRQESTCPLPRSRSVRPFASGTVVAEPLETFLEAERAALVPFFAKIETRARKELAGYPSLPEELIFKGG